MQYSDTITDTEGLVVQYRYRSTRNNEVTDRKKSVIKIQRHMQYSDIDTNTEGFSNTDTEIHSIW